MQAAATSPLHHFSVPLGFDWFRIGFINLLQEILGDCGRAAIQTQGSTSNPFGSTFVYGYQNIAFEVMKNGYISTVTMFQS
ncbi:hypothetical protein WN943_021188 [Citrus x changshan-huyou]